MPDESIAAIAEVSGKAPLEVCYDQMLLDGATGMIWRSLGGTMDVTAWYEDVKKRLECDRVVPALSDAGAHLAIFQDGTGPTSMLSFWGRDRVEGSGGFPIEYCVMKQARDPAHMFGLLDRGTIEVPTPDHISIESERKRRRKCPHFRVSSSVIKTVSIREKFKLSAVFIQIQPFFELTEPEISLEAP